MKNTYIIQRILYTLFIFALVVTLCFLFRGSAWKTRVQDIIRRRAI